jgi:hypothetical protein
MTKLAEEVPVVKCRQPAILIRRQDSMVGECWGMGARTKEADRCSCRTVWRRLLVILLDAGDQGGAGVKTPGRRGRP